MTMVSYEEQRLQNIKDNEALLLSLGLHVPRAKPKKLDAPVKKPVLVKKKIVPAVSTRPEVELDDKEGEADGRRRSTRSRKSVTYTDDGMQSAAESRRSDERFSSRKREREDSDEEEEGDYRQRIAARLGVRTQDPHSDISRAWKWGPGGRAGWSARQLQYMLAGISGNSEDGAWSVALSGGYPDDVDLGEAFTYTGSGGRDLKGTKQNPKNLRSAPQTFDQSFDNPKNAALKSAETRKPVRVIRGFKLDSAFAPLQGYRYDGLYTVEKAWMGKGLTKGLLVCRYAFKRVPGQPALPTRPAPGEDEENDEQRGEAI